MNRKQPRLSIYLAAFAITTLIFLLGLWVGNQLNQLKLDSLSELEQNIRTSTISTELQYQLLAENPCLVVNSTALAEELASIGTKLTFMEEELGKDDARVLQLKEYYSLLEIRHWLFLTKAKQECEFGDYGVVLFFYSNAGDCPDCDEQGLVLSYVHKKYPIFNIYSFDVNIANPAVATIKQLYNVTGTPTLVIEGKSVTGFQSREAVVDMLFANNMLNLQPEFIPERV